MAHLHVSAFLILLTACHGALALPSLAPTPSSVLPTSLQNFVDETSWYNDLALRPLIGSSSQAKLPHIVQTWLRNYLAAFMLYFASAGLWCLYLYYLKPEVFFPNGGIPSKEAMMLQIWVSMKSMPIYVLLPTLSEYMIERGWSRCYVHISEVGLSTYICLTLLYLALLEFGIYWMHRGLHNVKFLYKWFHAPHHIYNKENTLSPFAGLALHPIDGILQAAPHVIFIFIVPTHFLTHELLLFIEAIWTTNIHDCVHGRVWPIMGAGYHTIHHTTYRHNYGNYTIWMDWMFGTLKEPSKAQTSKSL